MTHSWQHAKFQRDKKVEVKDWLCAVTLACFGKQINSVEKTKDNNTIVVCFKNHCAHDIIATARDKRCDKRIDLNYTLTNKKPKIKDAETYTDTFKKIMRKNYSAFKTKRKNEFEDKFKAFQDFVKENDIKDEKTKKELARQEKEIKDLNERINQQRITLNRLTEQIDQVDTFVDKQTDPEDLVLTRKKNKKNRLPTRRQTNRNKI